MQSEKNLDKNNTTYGNYIYIFVFIISFLISFFTGYLIYHYCYNNNYTLYRLTNLRYQYNVLNDDKKHFFIKKRNYTNEGLQMNTFNI